jgi:aminopeptidase N
VGSDHFNKIIGSFYAEYSPKGATLDEFINFYKKLAPLDLEKFFNDWIYSTEAIKLVVEIEKHRKS